MTQAYSDNSILENELPREAVASRGECQPALADAGFSEQGVISPENVSEAITSDSTPDLVAAADFFSTALGGDPLLAVSICPQTKAVAARKVRDEAELGEWLSARPFVSHYYTTNSVKSDYGQAKKCAKADIAAARFLHVDIDPRADEELTGEKVRILSLLTDRRPGDVPEPSFIIDSGNGYQALWRLAEPYAVDGDEARVEEVENRNRWLEQRFVADKCHNIDRVLRLPGTINWPDEGKRKKGRKPVRAKLVLSRPDLTYELADFPLAPSASGSATTKADDHAVVAEPVAVTDLTAVEMPSWCRHLILEGCHPDDPSRYASRSEALFAVVCELVRADVGDGVVLGILLNREFRISDSVLEKGRGARRYAERQLSRAKDHAEDPELGELNERYAVVDNYGGKTVIVREDFGEATFIGVADLRLQLTGRRRLSHVAGGKTSEATLASWWLNHPKHRHFRKVVFCPGAEAPPDCFNLWQGFAVKPQAGDWTLLRQHIHEVLASGNADYAEYITRWAAWTFQNPGSPAEAALVLRGGKGTGKSMFGTALTEIFGLHGTQVSSMKQVTGNFNAHLERTCMLFADEAIAPREKDSEGNLKRMITEKTLTIERKGFDAFAVPNCLHVLMASNEDWVVPASQDERRYTVFDVSPHRQRDEAYFGALAKEMREGGKAAMLHDLLALDLGEWHPRKVLHTEALTRQIEMDSHPWEDALSAVTGSWSGSDYRVSSSHLLTDVLGIAPGRQSGEDQRRLKAVMTKLGWRHKRGKFGKANVNGYCRDGSAPTAAEHLTTPF